MNAAKILNAQLFIQNNLDADLSLDSVAEAVGVSPAHFHRMFKAYAGETLKRHVDRLRVEKSLYDIHITDLNLLQIALRYGFKNPETYSRVFRRHMGKAPSEFLKDRQRKPQKSALQPEVKMGLRQSEETNFSVTHLGGLHVAFFRHIGPYEEMPLVKDQAPTLWTELRDFVDARKLGLSVPIYLGIPQDMPGITPPEKLRFDGCLVVKDRFEVHGAIGYQYLSPGYFGVLTHAGPYTTLADAYRQLYQQAQQLKNFEIAPGPIFELFLDISARSPEDYTWTELYIPLNSKHRPL